MSAAANKSVVIFGPQGTGKTLHAEAIAKHFRLSVVVDGDFIATVKPQQKTDHLIISVEQPANYRRAMHINEALRRLRECPAGYPF